MPPRRRRERQEEPQAAAADMKFNDLAFTAYPTSEEEQLRPVPFPFLILPYASVTERSLGAAIEFFVYQYEIGEESGKTHIQGYIQFVSNLYKTRDEIVRDHIQGDVSFWCAPRKRRATPSDNLVYCTKDETRMPGTEWVLYGIPRDPKSRYASDAERALDMYAHGSTLLEVVIALPNLATRAMPFLTSMAKHFEWINKSERRNPATIHVYWGDSGCGKTSRARKEAYETAMSINGLVYEQTSGTKWWDGYNRQEVLFVDEIAADSLPNIGLNMIRLFQLCDGANIGVEAKGSCTFTDVKYLFFSSNLHPMHWLTGLTGEHEVAMRRRFFEHPLSHVTHMSYRETFGKPPNTLDPDTPYLTKQDGVQWGTLADEAAAKYDAYKKKKFSPVTYLSIENQEQRTAMQIAAIQNMRGALAIRRQRDDTQSQTPREPEAVEEVGEPFEAGGDMVELFADSPASSDVELETLTFEDGENQ